MEVVNEGSILGDGSNVLTLTQGVTNTGTVEADNGGALVVSGLLTVNESGIIATQPSASISVGDKFWVIHSMRTGTHR